MDDGNEMTWVVIGTLAAVIPFILLAIMLTWDPRNRKPVPCSHCGALATTTPPVGSCWRCGKLYAKEAKGQEGRTRWSALDLKKFGEGEGSPEGYQGDRPGLKE